MGMGRSEIWEQLHYEKWSEVLDDFVVHEGQNGYEMLRDRVIARLGDDDTMDNARNVFDEEYNNYG